MTVSVQNVGVRLPVNTYAVTWSTTIDLFAGYFSFMSVLINISARYWRHYTILKLHRNTIVAVIPPRLIISLIPYLNI